MAEPLSGDSSPSQVLLVNEQSVAREGLRRIFEDAEGLSVVDEAQSGEEALTKISEVRPDVAVISVSPKGGEGMGTGALIHELQDEYPEVGVVVVSGHEEGEYVKQVLKTGADGYVLEATVEESLVSATQAVSDGKHFLDPVLEDVM